MEGFADQGKVRNLGVSNIYNRSELEWLISEARIPVKVVQNRWYEGNGWDWDSKFSSVSTASGSSSKYMTYANPTTSVISKLNKFLRSKADRKGLSGL